MKELHPNEGLRIFDIKWQVKTAGPSPNENKRIEVFLLGCDKAMQGNPCKGCFNSVTWDKSIAEFANKFMGTKNTCFVVENPKYSQSNEIKSFGLHEKRTGDVEMDLSEEDIFNWD